MKKIALVLHGQGRSILSAYKSIKKEIIDVYKPDIFCHLWWDDEIKKNGYVGYGRHYIVDKDIPKIVTELYSPKKIVVEPKITDWETPELTNLKCGHYQTFVSQLYSIQKACDLFDWSEYDFIIKCRYDLEIIKFPELDKLHLHLAAERLYFLLLVGVAEELQTTSLFVHPLNVVHHPMWLESEI